MSLYTTPPIDLFNAFTETLGVCYDHEIFGFNFIGSGLGACGTLAVSPISDLTGRPGKSFLHLVQSPFGIFTIGESLPEMIHFFFGEAQDCYTVLALWVRVLMTLYLAER